MKQLHFINYEVYSKQINKNRVTVYMMLA